MKRCFGTKLVRDYMDDELSLFEKIDLALQGDKSYNEEIAKAINGKLKKERVDTFKEYVRYAYFPEEKGYIGPKALEFYTWLKGLNVWI